MQDKLQAEVDEPSKLNPIIAHAEESNQPPVSKEISKHSQVQKAATFNGHWDSRMRTPVLTVRSRTLTQTLQTKNLYSEGCYTALEKQGTYVIYPSSLAKFFGISYGVQLASAATSGWKFSLQPFRAVPEDALIFDLCRDGNILAVQRMLSKGLASPWDRDPHGRTPLWVRRYLSCE